MTVRTYLSANVAFLYPSPFLRFLLRVVDDLFFFHLHRSECHLDASSQHSMPILCLQVSFLESKKCVKSSPSMLVRLVSRLVMPAVSVKSYDMFYRVYIWRVRTHDAFGDNFYRHRGCWENNLLTLNFIGELYTIEHGLSVSINASRHL